MIYLKSIQRPPKRETARQELEAARVETFFPPNLAFQPLNVLKQVIDLVWW